MPLVDLQARQPQIGEQGVDLAETEVVEHLVQFIEPGLDQVDARGERLEHLARDGERIAIPVDADQVRCGVRRQDGGGMSGHAERGVHMHGIGRRQRRREQFNDPVEHHRGVQDVTGGVAGQLGPPAHVHRVPPGTAPCDVWFQSGPPPGTGEGAPGAADPD